MAGPILTPNRSRATTMLLFGGSITATLAIVAAIVLLWPSGDDDVTAADGTTTSTAERTTTTVEGATGEPSDRTTTTRPDGDPEPVDLFTSGAPQVLADLVSAAGGPTQAIEVLVYPEYAFLAYRDPAHPGNIDRRTWRDGEVSAPDPNPIDDRVDADTEPQLFDIAALDLGDLARLVDDAPGRFDLDVAVTHVIVNRFLPFDERVLIRVYASPTDGRSGGGYVQYTLDGTFVKVVQ